MIGNEDTHDELRALAKGRFQFYFIYTAFHIDQPHTCAEPHFTHLFGGGGVTGLKDDPGICNPRTLICSGHCDAMWFHFQLQDAAVGGVDNEIHLGFVDGNAAASRDLRVGTQADEGALDVARGFTALCEVTCFDGIA